MRSALFWDCWQHIVVIPYRRFGTTYFKVSSSPRTWPSSGRSLTKEHNNGRFCKTCADVVLYMKQVMCFNVVTISTSNKLYVIWTSYLTEWAVHRHQVLAQSSTPTPTPGQHLWYILLGIQHNYNFNGLFRMWYLTSLTVTHHVNNCTQLNNFYC